MLWCYVFQEKKDYSIKYIIQFSCNSENVKL